jgi:hypothetical protein
MTKGRATRSVVFSGGGRGVVVSERLTISGRTARGCSSLGRFAVRVNISFSLPLVSLKLSFVFYLVECCDADSKRKGCQKMFRDQL